MSSVQAGSANPTQGSWVTVRRNTDGSLGSGRWVDLNYPGVDPTTAIIEPLRQGEFVSV